MIIKTGTRFSAEDGIHQVYHYRFVGFDLPDTKGGKIGIGCHYIVFFNEEFQNETCVDKDWFRERKIIIEDAKRPYVKTRQANMQGRAKDDAKHNRIDN